MTTIGFDTWVRGIWLKRRVVDMDAERLRYQMRDDSLVFPSVFMG